MTSNVQSTAMRRGYRAVRPLTQVLRGVRGVAVSQPLAVPSSAMVSFCTPHAVRAGLWRVEIARPTDTSDSVTCAMTTALLLCCAGCESEDVVEFLHGDFVKIAFWLFAVVVSASLANVAEEAARKRRTETAKTDNLARQVASEPANLPPPVTVLRAPPPPRRSENESQMIFNLAARNEILSTRYALFAINDILHDAPLTMRKFLAVLDIIDQMALGALERLDQPRLAALWRLLAALLCKAVAHSECTAVVDIDREGVAAMSRVRLQGALDTMCDADAHCTPMEFCDAGEKFLARLHVIRKVEWPGQEVFAKLFAVLRTV